MPRVVVLGTGTSVGKTYVSVALLRALRDTGKPTLGLKPIETGIRTVTAQPAQGSDAHALEQASTLAPPRPHPLHVFEPPLSPHLAARRAGVEIATKTVARWVSDNTIQYTGDPWVCIETAGGAFSPLNDIETNADLASALEPALLLLVATDSLGVLHDVGATLAALRSRLRAPDHVVLTQARAPDPSSGTNADELRRLHIVDPIAVLQPSDTTALTPLVAALLEH